jgi:hypothetical protein
MVSQQSINRWRRIPHIGGRFSRNRVTLCGRLGVSVFSPYENAELDAMAHELDEIFARIATETAGNEGGQ